MDELIGKKLDGRYEIVDLIGEGGMANVYKATDLLENRVVAVKVLKDEFADNEELVRRFRNEGRAISVLDHPNIVKVYDVGVSPKMQYIVMEHIDGITLKEYIEQRGEPLTFKEVVHIMPQVLKALQHAHDRGVVHRDIKPQNIMIIEDGSIKVMDFGIARLARNEIHTQGDQTIGSVHYISPEQAQGAQTDPRADLYSAGIVMYEMLSGRLPFESDNAVSIAIKQISDEAVPIRDINPSVPEGLEEITMRAMAKDPKKRYRRAIDMLQDIEEFKKNPQIKFEYTYLTNDNPVRYIDNVVTNSKNTQSKGKTRKKKKKLKLLMPITLGVTFAVVITSAVICWAILRNSGNAFFTEQVDIELPDFIGMQISDVEKILKKSEYSSLRLDIQSEYNETKLPGEVIQQIPSPNKLVKSNQQLILTVCSEVEQVEIPAIIGMDGTEASKAISNLGLRPYVIIQNNASVEPGKVIDTYPAVGTVVPNTKDQTVRIYVSSNYVDYDKKVPDLYGLPSVDAARNALTAAGLTLGKVSEEYNDLPAGTVFDQTPEYGSVRKVGHTVSIKVSLGPEPPPPPEPELRTVPNVVGFTEADAKVILESAGFAMAISGQENDPTIGPGRVKSQSRLEGEVVDITNEGNSIVVVISSGPEATPEPTPAPPPAASEAPPEGGTP